MRLKVYRNIFLLVCLGLIAISVGIFFFWLFDPRIPSKVNVQPIRVLNKQVKQGGQLIYVIDGCKYLPIAPTISRYFTDGIIYQIPVTKANFKLGCHTNVVVIEVPSTLPPGIYSLHSRYEYQLNPLKDYILNTETEEFEVLAKEE